MSVQALKGLLGLCTLGELHMMPILEPLLVSLCFISSSITWFYEDPDQPIDLVQVPYDFAPFTFLELNEF